MMVALVATMTCLPGAFSPVESSRGVGVWRVRSSVAAVVAEIMAEACGACGVTLVEAQGRGWRERSAGVQAPALEVPET